MLLIALRGWLSKRILVVSEEVKRGLVEWYYYPEKRVVVEYHGTDVDRFAPDQDIRRQMRKNLGIPENDKVIVTVARFDKQKTIDRLIGGVGEFFYC